ncbi:MAG TPA: nuclear transport factor 2 family protein [Pseudonocardiaceae bacterium]|jgi:hypothetical protein|nr:nuclear transport factor 2 family protein [Pseudonocardiaceae bacterium]
MTTFRAAVEARDLDAIGTMLAEDVVFRSPVVFKPYRGRAITSAILRTVTEVFEDFHYVREVRDPSGEEVLVFEAKVDGLELTGCDLLRYDAEGKIVDFMVMVRPLRAAQTLQREMAARFAQIEADAIAAATVHD